MCCWANWIPFGGECNRRAFVALRKAMCGAMYFSTMPAFMHKHPSPFISTIIAAYFLHWNTTHPLNQNNQSQLNYCCILFLKCSVAQDKKRKRRGRDLNPRILAENRLAVCRPTGLGDPSIKEYLLLQNPIKTFLGPIQEAQEE